MLNRLPLLSRRAALGDAKAMVAGRNSWGRFEHPHSYNGVNPAFNNLPEEDRFETILRDMKPGDKPPLAY
jgi:hypothetical protein